MVHRRRGVGVGKGVEVEACILDRRTIDMDSVPSENAAAPYPEISAEERDDLLEERLSTIDDREPRRRMSSEERARRQRLDRGLFELLQQLKCARMLAGYSQAYLAKHLCTTASAISRLESGLYSRPTLTTIENYAQVLGYLVEIRLTRVRRPLATVPHMRFLC